MLWFVAILATVNLCVGYVLGARFGWLPFGAAGVAAPAEVSASPAPAPPTVDPPAPAGPEPPQPETPGAAADPAAEEPSPAAEAPPPAAAKPTPTEVMQGLAAFQAKLADLGKELQGTADDDAFDQCAVRMQQANHEYLDQASEAVEQLDGDQQAAPVRIAVQQGAQQVQQTSDEFDATLASDEPRDAARAKLRDLSDTLVKTSESTSQEVGLAVDGLSLPPLEVDTNTGLATLDSMFDRLDALLESGEGKPPLVVATVRPDPPAEGPRSPETIARLLPKIGELVGEVIGGCGPAAVCDDDRLFLLLNHDSVDDASRRMEQVRQQVEATTFLAGGDREPVTVSCALAQSSPDATRDLLREHLDEALAEADRYGGNRACHHDGKFPAPVMPEDVEVAEREVAL